MTVQSIDTIEYANKPRETMVACQWFYSNEARKEVFPSASLKAVSEQT